MRMMAEVQPTDNLDFAARFAEELCKPLAIGLRRNDRILAAIEKQYLDAGDGENFCGIDQHRLAYFSRTEW